MTDSNAPISAVPCRPNITLLSRSEKVRRSVKYAVSLIGGSLDYAISPTIEVAQAISAPDIYVIDTGLLEDPARDVVDLLDDKLACVVLFGGPAGLAATRPAVRRMVNIDMGPEVLATTLKSVLAEEEAPDCPPKLSPRERETLRFYGRGLTLKEIGHSLGISAKSAETYKTRACRKLHLTSRAAVLAFTEPSLRRIGLRGGAGMTSRSDGRAAD
jgi:DNA-binding CsgD family transcriptional regulator